MRHGVGIYTNHSTKRTNPSTAAVESIIYPTSVQHSPVRLVPKHNGSFHHMHYLSFPPGNSVNDSIPTKFAALSYLRLKDVFSLILQVGRICVITRRDIKDAFRNIPIVPSSQWLFGLYWREDFYEETCLPFGPATVPFVLISLRRLYTESYCHSSLFL